MFGYVFNDCTSENLILGEVRPPLTLCPWTIIMILREDDWGYYDNAVIDYNTPNKSFLKLAFIHKELGVKHWFISLALHNPTLAGVNPHGTGLTIEQKAGIAVEMMDNPWFHFREICKVPQDGTDPVPFRINRGSFALFWTFFNNIDLALLMIRQQGKTVAVVCLLVHLKRILKDSRSILLTRGSDLRTETISKMKQVRDSYPKYLWKHDRFDADNTEIFTYNARSNKLLTCIAQNSKESALNAGRGITTARLFSDETAFTKFARIMLPAALAAGTTARRIAEEHGIPYGNLFTTTPGKRDEPDGNFVYTMFHNGFYWKEALLDVPTREELIQLINTNSKGDRTLIHAPFTHRQLGLTDLDLYKAMANAGGTKEEQLRDFGLQWTAGSLMSPLTVDEAKVISDSKTDPAYIEIFPNNYVLNWYYRNEVDIANKMQVKHIIGLDTSDAVGRDNISLVILNSETLETAAVSIVNESNLVTYANWLADLLIKYPSTILVIERKSSAPTMIDALLLKLPANGVEPAQRMFNAIVQTRENDDEDLIAFKRLRGARDDRFYDTYRKYFGFVTTGPLRDRLYSDTLKNGVKIGGGLIRDKGLASELLALVVKDGRIDHKASGHDDCVIAWLLACWFMFYGKRLDFYGVNNRVLMRRQALGATGTEEELEDIMMEDEEQRALSDEIDELCSKITQNRNPFIKTNLERQLRVKLAGLKLDTSQASTLGELQDLIRNEKLKSRYS